MTTNALVTVSDIERMAGAVAKSKLFGIKTPDEAMALMLIAQAEGLHPAIAARDYHIINGKPSLKADAMLARFQTAGGSVKWNDYTDTKCSATISHPQGGTVTVEWTIEMAKKIGLTKNATWTNYPRQMLRARVISEGIRTVFPGVAVGIYTPEEVQDFDDKPMKDITPMTQPEGSDTNIKNTYGTAKAMKTRWIEIRDAINKCQDHDALGAVKEQFRADFANFKALDAELFSQIVNIGEQRRKAIDDASPVPQDRMSDADLRNSINGLPPEPEGWQTEDPLPDGQVLPEFLVRGHKNVSVG